MNELLRIFLPTYFIVYFGIAFVAKSVLVAKRIGKNPLVLPKDDTAYGLIGFYFKLTMILLFVYVLLFALIPTHYNYFLPIQQLDTLIIKCIGLGLLVLALIWTIIAQGHMKNSWRIGIDTETKTELITTGLFQFSRNPIFFGMIVSLVGLFLTTPNALTGLFLVLGYVLIQIQIRLEEEFLTNQHRQKYLDYKQKVRRMI
ncbi:MAG TPA: isoprenylcysteine carboxylmethyltransferase family protein [Cyclobacteriaceae bacterium]|jgi:protein-S-isoprenylcysteine O-methyltransferase Ste14|nr:isoprenylcysteine carboxylmethyltransferase family protein [Cytophagales bacterium]HMR56734.1 isoprenylcysteine carboxylmethyltransferase family protein [Cyclobacteriaceae bacterium]HNT49948.1 isoprenylcysteine carboxylmethyltransferase family protein [Cyclobacteriaceae bacterium]HRE67071.1 isoprenylcysteine carboxylmethyltransferase family protein [Cyclobacteriaceae bacterium]HRF32318.1 isoprenylcysteine carboxylmethyltransferase family protein [Cyclobacteriaceae bacterium]